MWQLKYKTVFFDIQPGQSPEIERNSPLFLIENLLQEKSTPIIISYSDKISLLTGHIFFELTSKVRQKIPVEVHANKSYLCNAIFIIDGAQMKDSKTSTATVSGYLVFGVSNFFSTIKDKKLSDLSLGGERIFNYTTSNPTDTTNGYWQHFQDTYDFEHDYIFPPYKNLAFDGDIDIEFTGIYLWGNKFDGAKIVTTQPVIPFVKLEYVLKQICEEHGWKLDTSGLNDEHWKKLILYSNYTISTANYSLSSGSLTSTPKASVTIDLKKAMPANVNCSTFLIQICKRYLWAPLFDTATNTCRLVALKEMYSKQAKDWSRYASYSFESTFPLDTKTYSFKNNFDDDDSLPSIPDFSQWPLIGYADSFNLLPNPEFLNENMMYYVSLENKWFVTVYNTSSEAVEWIEFSDNIYNEETENATLSFETDVTTVPVIKGQFDNGHFGLLPVVNQPKNTKWGIRTVLYHGFVPQVDNDGSPLSLTYPYASSLNITPAQDIATPWSNIYKHQRNLDENGMIEYWAKKWMLLISSVEEVRKRIFLPLHELVNFKWDDIININSRRYLIKSFLQPLSSNQDGQGFIDAKLQPLTCFSIAPVAPPAELLAMFDGYITLAYSAFHWVGLQYLKGEPGATLTLKVYHFAESDPDFYFKVNDVEYYLDNTFTITLDSAGEANYNVKLGGVTEYGEAIMVRLEIIATSTGAIGFPNTVQYDKITG